MKTTGASPSLQSGASSIDEEKALVRTRVLARLRALTVSEKTAASEKICQHLLQSALLQNARCVGSFAGLASEPELSVLHQEVLRLGKRLAFPRVIPSGLEFRSHDHAETWLRGPHGPREPDPARSALVLASEIDLVLAPGLAFAPGGFRLGRGGGYYDRWLAGERPGGGSVGVCFSCQVEARLPVANHDQRVDGVLTEGGWLLTGNPGEP